MTKTLALLGLTAGVVLHGSAAEAGAQDCAAADVEFVCDQVGPEDLAAAPGTPWVLASSYPEGSGGLRVIDTRDLTTTALLPAAAPRERFDRATYGSCPGPVAVDNTHGLYVAPGTGPVRTVYATHHGARESVEVFELDVGTEPPELTWIGCVVAPEPLNLNSVVALPDGGFAATSFRDLGAPIEPIMTGAFSGAIWEWRPGAGWEMVPGSETSGPNGLEISPDGRWFYVGGWGTQSFIRLSRGRTPIQRAEVAAEFRIDNLRMQPDGSILATGQGSKGAPMTTSNVARVDPETLTLEEIIRRPNDETFAMGTTAIEVGDEIWVGSLQGDRIARFPAE